MLKVMSRFVLEVLPYMLSALIAAIVVPGFLMSQFQEISWRELQTVPIARFVPSNWCMRTTLLLRPVLSRSSKAVHQLVAK